MADTVSDKFKGLCTIVTDASHCHKEHVAGWAVWIVFEGKRHKQYGAFKEKCPNSHIAEIKAIINGIFIADKVFKPERFHIVSDCKTAMLSCSSNAEKGKWKKQVHKITGERQITFKHVKAHTNTADKRSWVNRWCDRMAKDAMRESRQQSNSKEGVL